MAIESSNGFLFIFKCFANCLNLLFIHSPFSVLLIDFFTVLQLLWYAGGILSSVRFDCCAECIYSVHCMEIGRCSSYHDKSQKVFSLFSHFYPFAHRRTYRTFALAELLESPNSWHNIGEAIKERKQKPNDIYRSNSWLEKLKLKKKKTQRKKIINIFSVTLCFVSLHFWEIALDSSTKLRKTVFLSKTFSRTKSFSFLFRLGKSTYFYNFTDTIRNHLDWKYEIERKQWCATNCAMNVSDFGNY